MLWVVLAVVVGLFAALVHEVSAHAIARTRADFYRRSWQDASEEVERLRAEHRALVERVFGAAGLPPAPGPSEAPEPQTPFDADNPLVALDPMLEEWVQQWDDPQVQAKWRRKIDNMAGQGMGVPQIIGELERPAEDHYRVLSGDGLVDPLGFVAAGSQAGSPSAA